MKKQKNKCCYEGCKNTPEKGRKKCEMHRRREWRAANPVKAIFRQSKDNAKRRGKPFELSLQYFEKLVTEDSNYINERGRTPDALTIDRIRHFEGYVPGNVRVIPHYQNCVNGYYESQNLPCPY